MKRRGDHREQWRKRRRNLQRNGHRAPMVSWEDRKLHAFVQNSEQAPDVVFGIKVPMEESESGDLMSSTFRIHERDISTCCSQLSGECRSHCGLLTGRIIRAKLQRVGGTTC